MSLQNGETCERQLKKRPAAIEKHSSKANQKQHKKKGVEARGAAEAANPANLIHGRLLAR